MSKVELSDNKNDIDCVVDISSGDDTDYESGEDYQQLEPKVLEVHLNASAESGKSVISVKDDIQIVEEKFKESTKASSGYNNAKYFNKKRVHSKIDTERISENHSSSLNNFSKKKLKMEDGGDADDVIIISDDECDSATVVSNEENKPDIEDVKVNVTKKLDSYLDNLGSRDQDQLAKLETIRRWRMTGLGNALLSGDKKPCKTDVKFRVLSYNILAQKNLTGHQNLYRGKQQYLLDWEYRWTGLQREVQTYNPDIVTFQEVQFSGPDHYSQQINPWFSKLGYEFVSQCRTGDKVDGCAIFYRSDKFSLVTSRGVQYRQAGVTVLDKDNVGIVCVLRATNGSRLAVATTHLLFNPKRHEIRLAQTAVLLTELDRLAWDTSRQGYIPAILTGDLNLQPFSDTYNLITKGTVRYAGVQCGRYLLPDQLLPDSMGIADTCQGVAELARRCITPKMGSGAFSHQFGFRSVYNHSRYQDTRVPVGGYEATTFHSTWVTVDYIFYSTVQSGQGAGGKDGRQEGKLKLLGRMSLLTGPEISALGGLPSAICPSDHLPLLAEFCLKV